MKLPIPCIQCCANDKQWVFIEIRNEDRYEIRCPNGHVYTIWLQNPKFEILFETGAIALLQGYYIEAVTAMHASLERFHEFCIRVILLKHGVDFEHADDTWKYVSKQSERQLGAFLFLYLIENKAAQKVSEDVYSFRNRVIHNGHIPSYDEVYKNGSQIYGYIVTVLKDLKARTGDFFSQIISRQQRGVGEPIAGLCIPTIISHTDGELGSKNFKDAFDELKLDRIHRHYQL